MDILLQELGQFRTRVKIVEDKGLSAVYWSLYFFVRWFGRKSRFPGTRCYLRLLIYRIKGRGSLETRQTISGDNVRKHPCQPFLRHALLR